jgi:hypothetical protein
MTSWTVVRDFMTKDTQPNSVGYQVGLIKASDLFTRLLGCLTESEREAAFEEWKREPKLVEALSRREDFQDLGLFKTWV